MAKNKLTIKIGGDASEFKKELSTLGSVAKKGLSAATKGVAAFSGLLTGLGVQAVKGYSEYEQLIGGVETLFKTSSEKVKANAAKAYETAGLSANKYMETATGFAASLKQSFEDTAEGIEAAADCADMAVIDMADNANKMGTNMQSIQDAYQGFAKQNYTMLDNLKLGYGGTKTEMERLLADAEKLSGIHYNIDSLADVYNAIHVIQTELGITGTTAEEAATTISGSMGMAKAAAQNLMTGLSDSNADLDELMQNFIDSVLTAGDNLLPAVQTTLTGIGALASKAGRTFVPKLVDVILSTLPQLVKAAAEVMTTFTESLIKQAPQLAKAAAEILAVFAAELGNAVPILKPAAKIIQLLAEHLDSLTAVIVNAGTALLGLYAINKVITAFKAANTTMAAFKAAVDGVTAAETVEVAASLALEGAMKPLEVIVGVVTGKINLQTAATVALAAAKKLLTDHTGLLVAAGIALAAGLVTLIIQTRQQSEADKERAARLEELKSRTEELSEAAESQAEAYQSAVDSINQSASVKILELDRTKELADELTELADENGKVEDADKSRAAYILGELNKAMGTEYTMVGNQIQKYGDLKASIYDTIEAMQAKIVLSAYEEQLTEAIKKQAEAQENAAGAADAVIQAEKDKAETIDAFIEKYKAWAGKTLDAAEAEEKLNNGILRHGTVYSELARQYDTCTEAIAENKKRLEESGAASQEVAELREKVSDSAMQIELKNYDAVLNGYQVSEEAKQAIASGSQDKLLDQLRNTYDEIAALETQRDNASAEHERAGWEQRIREVGESGKALLEALSGMGIDADNAVAGIIAEAAKACGELPAEFKTSAEMSVEGIIAYLTSEEAKKKVYEAAYALGLAEHAGYQDARGEASPAKEYIKSAKYTIDGIIKGLDDNEDKLMSRMEELADDELSAAMAGNHALLAAEREYLSESRRMERKKEEKEYQEKLAAAKTAEAVQKLKNERLEKLQEEADERYLERLKEAAEKEREILEERKNQLIDSFQEAADAAMDAIDDLADRQEDFYDKLSDSRELFRKKTITIKGAGEDGSDLQFTESHLTDLDAQNKALQEYADLLLKVRSRGELPDGFFDELRDMSIEDGTAFAEALLAADDETFAAYLASWQSIQDTSEKLSKEIFGEDAAELERKLTEEFGKLPEDFFDIGEESIQQFGDGFMGKLRELMQNVRREIQSSMSYLSPIAAVAGGGTVSTAGDSVTYYNTTYNLTASGSTVNEQLHAIRSEETRKKLAGL